VISGYNTDVEHQGTRYHVQTEDKGPKVGLIVSLIYVGGEILASKRTSYEDLICDGKVDEAALAERLQRQHKLICAAIRAGRVEELKRLGKKDSSLAQDEESPGSRAKSHKAGGTAQKKAEGAVAKPEVAPRDSHQEAKTDANGSAREGENVCSQGVNGNSGQSVAAADESDELSLTLLRECDFRAGKTVLLAVKVAHGDSASGLPDAWVKIKVLGTTFRPAIFNTRTDRNGIAMLRLMLPHFTSGRAAILIEATANGHRAELRRLIHHA